MVSFSVLDSGLSGPGSSPVAMGNMYCGVPMLGVVINRAMDLHPIQGEQKYS